jgi:hypothetical protein
MLLPEYLKRNIDNGQKPDTVDELRYKLRQVCEQYLDTVGERHTDVFAALELVKLDIYQKYLKEAD